MSGGNTHSVFNFSFKTRISKLVTRDKESEKNIFAFPKANLKVPGPNIYLKKLKRGQTIVNKNQFLYNRQNKIS